MRTGIYEFMSSSRARARAVTLLALLVPAACAADSKGDVQSTKDGESDPGAEESSSAGVLGSSSDAAEDGGSSPMTTVDPDGDGSSEGKDSGFTFDVGGATDLPFDPDACGAPPSVSCDEGDDVDPWHAIGLNCNGGPQVDGIQQGDPLGFYIHEGNLGTYEPAEFPPREGDKLLVMSSG